MFERFTEGARRSVFFARYEASQLGTPYISTEHLLLGILREDKALIRQMLLNVDYESARREVAARVAPDAKKFPTYMDLPLAEDAKEALKGAMEEADRLNATQIGTEHLLLGLVREEDSSSAKLLSPIGASLELLRKRVEALPARVAVREPGPHRGRIPLSPPSKIEVHGRRQDLESIHVAVTQLRSHDFYWERKPWQARDVVYEKNRNRFSFDVTLAQDVEKFLLVKGGWKKDNCAVCGWELFESDDPSHGTAFTNGTTWVCEECHRRFIAEDFFHSTYSDLT